MVTARHSGRNPKVGIGPERQHGRVRERLRMYLGPYGSGNAGTARRVDDRLGRVPHGLDDEEHVVDDDAANRHRFTLSTPGLGPGRTADASDC
jgi:hypothetical protein